MKRGITHTHKLYTRMGAKLREGNTQDEARQGSRIGRERQEQLKSGIGKSERTSIRWALKNGSGGTGGKEGEGDRARRGGRIKG